MTEMGLIIKRVKAAPGPDRELDCQIAYHLDFQVEGMAASFRKYCDVHDLKWGEIARHANSYQSILYHSLPRFTASVDAALALVERLLGHAATVEIEVNIGAAEHYCTITLFERDLEPFATDGLRTPALAILAALITALQAIGEQP